jgi:hypothetical protein
VRALHRVALTATGADAQRPRGSPTLPPRPNATPLLLSRILLFGAVALSFPLASVAVFGLGSDRQATAAVLSVIYGFGLILAMSTAFWPFAETQSWTRARRVESLVLVYLGMSYFTHLSWELGWLMLRERIAASPDALWSYPWWAYIDGGDFRYASPSIHLVVMELLSVVHGWVGAIALTVYLRSGRRSGAAVVVFVASGAIHLYSASLYYLTELLDGMRNVDTSSFVATYVKFGLANAPWVVVPGFVFWWARQKLLRAEQAGLIAPD